MSGSPAPMARDGASTPGNRKGQPAIPSASGSASSPWPGSHPPNRLSNQPRNLPVKRYDGDPLGRVDVQHALLSLLFSDIRRVFTNPRPGAEPRVGSSNVTMSNGEHVPTPVWPYGTSKGCVRRSDETAEEFEAWKARKARYDKWKRRMTRKANAPRAAEEKSAQEAAAVEAKAKAKAAAEGADDAADDRTPNNEEEDELAATASNDGQTKLTDAGDAMEEEEVIDDDEDEFPKPGCERLTFKELYLEALLNSGKCTKSMRDKIVLDEEYAEDFAKVCLLVNVGRINTTLAFYPEMKTVLRSYHPLPSMQNNENTRRNMQDAPRMKSLLKAVLLDNERASAPTVGPTAGQPPKPPKVNLLSDEAPGDFKEVIKRYREGTRPPTSVVTLIFLLSLHANDVTAFHFPEPHDAHALFYPHPSHPLPARQRAEAFLWIIYHYLEGPATQPPGEQDNPFDDEKSKETTRLAREAWESLSEDEKKRQAGLPWKGLVNPEWLRWKGQEDKKCEVAEGGQPNDGTAAGAASTSETIKDEATAAADGDGDGDVSMKDADSDDKDAKKGAPAVTKDDGSEILTEPPSHTHRLLVPTLDVISSEEAALENVDTEEEIQWGRQMQSERATFLSKFQEEEAAKNAAGSHMAGSPAPSTATAAGKGRGRGSAVSHLKREEMDRGATPSDAGDASFTSAGRGKKRAHPLASTTTASAAAQGLAGVEPKRSRIAMGYDDSPQGTPFYPATSTDVLGLDPSNQTGQDAAISTLDAPRIRPSLWDLDLTLPRHQMHESLPQLAWARILDRAQRGVGDACYESDVEEFAEEEAQAGERSKGEVYRILKGLRACVSEDVFREENERLSGERVPV